MQYICARRERDEMSKKECFVQNDKEERTESDESNVPEPQRAEELTRGREIHDIFCLRASEYPL